MLECFRGFFRLEGVDFFKTPDKDILRSARKERRAGSDVILQLYILKKLEIYMSEIYFRKRN